jgi:phosphoribosylformimino-5-aminoimidazole carboxamide ribotide isomerase
MIIFPAIDLMGGQVVRLEQGKKDVRTTYGSDPVAVARDFQAQGAQALHVVDLDGAFSGVPQNLAVVAQIVAALDIPVELGGGLREEQTLADALSTGVARVILGTRACESLEFVARMVARFGGEKIAAGIDAKDGKVAVKGWTEQSEQLAVPLARELEKAGVGLLIYTDIATDGMFTGPNYPALQELLAAVRTPVIASGGVGTVDHIRKLREIPNLYGAIVGKALYDRKFTLAEIL